ncbi:hypothetical protein SCH01S_35_00160 [Sphingomonas changbaiensis NBRC 104936]|uniref:Phosphatidate cytidylyltransferase n=1 Tax=Sphingomonas changbaiensis NBRC 104936 TaxID=1219043 RepID=A0A0E9MQ71_9SPHN|nr:hypothetical protein [Sphingomonas changbaiensis]GAO39581.1 hypothetical protein SCH01S_35_00160 [Sphingomonas changbaiensis NBRC 104936]
MGDLEQLIADELAQPVDPRAVDAAAAIAAGYPGARAVLFYGSCLRTGAIDGQMLDFYLIVRDYREAYGKRWLAWANLLIPPNVFPFERNGVAAKYAVLSEADFMRLTGPEASTVSVWARFAQPARLVWAADDAARDASVQAVARAPATLLSLAPVKGDLLERWRAGFTLTYSAELRAERGDRPGAIVDWDPARYERIGSAITPMPLYSAARWRSLRRMGKLMTLVRLAKASLTFAGGVDYLAWKINRHAGAGIVVKPWQRRHPLLGAIILLPRLLRKGAVR